MIEIVALIGSLLGIATLASERRMNVFLWVGLPALGWVLLAVLFRYLFPLGIFFALLPWACIFVAWMYVKSHEVPVRKRNYEGLDELMKDMEEARANVQERSSL